MTTLGRREDEGRGKVNEKEYDIFVNVRVRVRTVCCPADVYSMIGGGMKKK